MKKFALPRLTQKLMCELWCVLPSTHSSMRHVLASKLSGHDLIPRNWDESDSDDAGARVKNDVPLAGPYGSVMQPGSKLFVRGNLGIIPVDGVIGIKLSMLEMMCGGCSIELIQAQTEEAYNRPDIKRVLYDVSSPGGMGFSLPETAQMVRELTAKKPTYSVTEELCASAAEWITCGVGTRYATQNAIVGSIGCYIAILDDSKQMEMEGLNLQIMKAGTYKAAGQNAPLSDEERAIYQSIVDENYAQFTADVVKGRKAAGKKVDASTMQGQIFSGKQGLAVGLVDALVPSALSIVRRLS